MQQGGSHTTLQHARFKLMVAILTEKEGMVQEDSLPAALEKVNAMIRSLRNKKPNVRIGHWNWHDDVNGEDLLEEVPTDVNIAEKKVMYGFQRFVRPGQYCYYCLNQTCWQWSRIILTNFASSKSSILNWHHQMHWNRLI